MAEAEFHQLLMGLASPDNNTRAQAEESYEKIPVVDRFKMLTSVVASPNNQVDLQQLASVLLRRIITTHFQESFAVLDDATKEEVKAQLIRSVEEEGNDAVRRKKADCVSELSRKLVDDNGNNAWPQVLQFMFRCVSSHNVGLKAVPLHVFCQFPGIFGNQQDHYREVIRQMLGQCMQAQETEEVRFLAAKATIAFLLDNNSDTPLIRQFSDLIPGVLLAAGTSAAQDQDTVFKSLVELCEEAPKVVRPHVENLLTVCLNIVSNCECMDNIRQLALETIVTLAETAPGLVRKQKQIIPMIVPQMLAMMIDLDDEPEALAEWSVTDEAEEDDCDANTVAGENALDRFACAVGGKTMLPHIMATVPPMLQNPDWRYRHGGLMALSAVGEGCHKFMEEILQQVVEAVLPFLRDQHPRVRYAACNAVGQMCTDFASTMQKQFHEKLIPALCSVLEDQGNPRVQAHAGAALVNFVEDCPKTVLVPYLEPLCSKLELVLSTKIQELVQKGTKLVLEQVTTTIAAVADTAEEQFTPFYDRFMPSLKYIMENAHSDELRMLRGKTIECISLIGLAVGSEKFMPDAQAIMEQLLKTQANIESWEDDDPQISYMISAWARMCKLLGQKFVSYLPVVMGPLMKAASIKPEVTMLDSQDLDTIDEDDGWEFIKLGDQQSFGIKTAGLEEKSTACQMLVCYARELKEGFVDYVEEVVKLMAPLLKFYFHDGVRSSAAESIPLLMECAELRGPEYVGQIWSFIAPNILTAINDEPDKDVLSIVMESLARCIELRGKGCFTMDQYQDLTKLLNRMLEQHFQQANERLEKRQDEDYDEQVEEALQVEDQEDFYILSKIADVLHSLFGSHGSEIFPLFDTLLPHYAKLLDPQRPWADRQWSLCVFDDVIEYTKHEALKYQEVFLTPMLTYIEDSSGEVRQAASYGIGVMAKCAGEAFANAIKDAIPRLRRVIEGPMGRGIQSGQLPHDDVAPLENCISAVGKILQYQPQLIGTQDDVVSLLRSWLSWLPVTEDKEEAVHVYGYVCYLIENRHPVLLGENNCNLPAVISLLADAVYGEALQESKELTDRVIAICKQIQESANDVWVSSLAMLPQPMHIALNNLIFNIAA